MQSQRAMYTAAARQLKRALPMRCAARELHRKNHLLVAAQRLPTFSPVNDANETMACVGIVGAIAATVVIALVGTDAACESTHDNNGASHFFDEDYDVKQLVGSGSFGMVMQCVSKKDGRLAAVKMIQDVNDIRDEVTREKLALESIQEGGGHHNIVHYDGSYEHDGFYYIVTEFIEGESLYSCIEKNRRLDVPTAVHLTSQLAAAIAFLRTRNLIHRDLKPANIMVTSTTGIANGSKCPLTLKVIDFGSAIHDSECNQAIAQSGTRCYWPPEMLAHLESSPAMDVWALGCIMYIMIAGRHPFDRMGSSTEAEVVHRVLTENVSFLHPVWTNVPCSVKNLIRGLLDKDPSTRLSIDEVRVHPALHVDV